MKKGFAALMQRVGILEKTVDPAFEEEREAWKAFQSEANEVLVALRRQADATKAAVAPLQAVDNALRDVYGESHAAYITWQKAFVTASSSLLVFLVRHTHTAALLLLCAHSLAPFEKNKLSTNPVLIPAPIPVPDCTAL